MAGRKKGTPKTGGRQKGTPNKATRAMKDWAVDLFESPEWRESARERIVAGKAPHLEAHCLQVLMPKTEKHEHVGPVQIIVSGADERL